MPQPAFFHEESRAVRFWVQIDGADVGAIISQQTLHYRFCPAAQGDEPLATYRAFAQEIHAAVTRRVARGSIEPVIVREFDLPPAA